MSNFSVFLLQYLAREKNSFDIEVEKLSGERSKMQTCVKGSMHTSLVHSMVHLHDHNDAAEGVQIIIVYVGGGGSYMHVCVHYC